MNKLECCRTCFSSCNLKQIFGEDTDFESYSNDLFVITGMKIEKGDMLSQLMCSACTSLVASFFDFRKKCKETNERFMELIENSVKIEVHISISEGDVETEDKNNMEINDDFVEHEGSLDDLLKQCTDIVFSNDKGHNKVNLSFMKAKVKEELERKEEEYPKQCPKCPKTFNTKRNYGAHLNTHAMLKAVCEYCGKHLKDARALVCHYKAKHGHEKTDKCRFCDYRGTKVETVKIHERTHTGEKPYVCATCGVGFHRKSSYVQHVALHLPEKTVKCDFCPAMFKSVTLMQIHRSNRHRLKNPPITDGK